MDQEEEEVYHNALWRKIMNNRRKETRDPDFVAHDLDSVYHEQ